MQNFHFYNIHFLLKIYPEVSVVVHSYNPSTQENEEGGSWVPGQPGLHSNMISDKKKKKKDQKITLIWANYLNYLNY
jgi:hypothetical protein